MTAAYRVVCSQDAWCRSDNDRHRLPTEAAKTRNVITLGTFETQCPLHSLDLRPAPGGELIYCITTLGHTNSIAVELCSDAFRIPSCPGGFTIQISSRLIISRLKLIHQLFFLVKSAIDIFLHCMRLPTLQLANYRGSSQDPHPASPRRRSSNGAFEP